MAEQEKAEAEKELLETIQFHYIKSNYFRMVQVGGIYGSISPNGSVQISFYSERYPIPKSTMHAVGSDGELGDEIEKERVSLRGIVREVELGASMDVKTAETLVEWLQEAIQSIKEIEGGTGEK